MCCHPSLAHKTSKALSLVGETNEKGFSNKKTTTKFAESNDCVLTEGSTTGDREFRPAPVFKDAALARIFAYHVLAFLVSREFINPEITGKVLSWHHTGFIATSRREPPPAKTPRS